MDRLLFSTPLFRDKQLAETGALGFVGAGFFADYEIVLDYRRQRMTLIPRVAQQASHRCRGQIIPLVREVNWGLVSRANTEVGNLLFVWDTGSPALFMLKASALAAHLDVSQGAVTLKHVRMNAHDYGPLRFEIRFFSGPCRLYRLSRKSAFGSLTAPNPTPDVFGDRGFNAFAGGVKYAPFPSLRHTDRLQDCRY